MKYTHFKFNSNYLKLDLGNHLARPNLLKEGLVGYNSLKENLNFCKLSLPSNKS
jgi:hypothetical protein